MSLIIKTLPGGKTIVANWHVGEPVPALPGHAFLFTADGDELGLLMDAMQGLHPVTMTPEQAEWLRNLRDEARSVAHSTGAAQASSFTYRAKMAEEVLEAFGPGPEDHSAFDALRSSESFVRMPKEPGDLELAGDNISEAAARLERCVGSMAPFVGSDNRLASYSSELLAFVLAELRSIRARIGPTSATDVALEAANRPPRPRVR